jgi:N4-gp56 family major capsid protein
MNYSYSSGIAPTMLEAYLQRRALENVMPELGYLNDAEMIEQPVNSASKHVRMFRYTELPAIDTPLQEGVTPDPQSLTETAFTVMTKQYGGYMDYTDEIDLWHIDKKTQAMSDRLNRQARLTIDNVGRDAICSGLNVMFPGAVSARSALTASNIITYDLIKKAVRNLKRKGAQPFADGFFHAKIDHDTYYDISQDSHWINVATYQNDTRVQKYELGTIYNVKFFAVDNGKVFSDQSYLYGTTASLTQYGSFDATNRIMTITETMTEDIARQLTGKLVYVKRDGSSSLDKVTMMCIERIWPSGTANTTKILFRWVPAATETNEWTTAHHTGIYPTGGGNSIDVHATVIYGQKAFGCVTLGSKKKPNFKIIVKPLGSSGTADPLDQRGTIAWKVPFFAAAVLQDDFIVRIEHGVSA